jgi:hypothetical protein
VEVVVDFREEVLVEDFREAAVPVEDFSRQRKRFRLREK